MIRFYKNSVLASIVSIIGCLTILVGIMTFRDYGVEAVLAIIVGLVPQIAQNTATAVAIYNKNPQKRTLKKIAELNPEAARQIEASIAAKKKRK